MKTPKLFQTPAYKQYIIYKQYIMHKIYRRTSGLRPDTYLDYLVCESNKHTPISLIHQVKIAINWGCI